MARTLSRILTAVTVLALGALLLFMILDPLIETRLSPLIESLGWTLGVLIVIRLLLSIRRLRSGVAAPVMGAASVQSRLLGFSPGSSKIEDPNGPTYTTSKIEKDSRDKPGGAPL